MKSIYPVLRLGELVNVKGGKRLPKGTGYASQPTKYPYLRVCDFANSSIDETELQFLTEETQSQISRYVISSDDVYISIAGTIGLSGLVPKHLDGANLTENAAKLVIRDKTIVDKRYLSLYLRTNGQREIKTKTKATSQPKLALFRIEELEIPLPPIDKQRRIAAILDKADAVRRKRKEAIALTEDLLRSAFLEMFGDPVTNPKEWDVAALETIGKWSAGGTPSRKTTEYFTGDVNWYSAGELNYRYLSGSREKISEEALGVNGAKLFKSGSLLVGMYDTAAFKLGILKENSASNQACANIFPDPGLCDVDWLYTCFEIMRPVFLQSRRGIRQQNLSQAAIKKFEIPLPAIEIQQNFSDFVRKQVDTHDHSLKSLEESENLFNSLLQRAFRGDL